MRKVKAEGFFVSGRSDVEIRRVAEQIRKLFYPFNDKYLNIINLLEHKLPEAFPGFRYEIVEDWELPDREAEMNPSEFCIRIRESIYTKANDGDSHCRFTIAHELGHFFLHRDQALAFGHSSTDGYIPAYHHSEWQANTFARHLLAPQSLSKGMATEEVEVVFGVSRSVAEIVSGHHTLNPMSSKTPSTPVAPCLPGFEFL